VTHQPLAAIEAVGLDLDGTLVDHRGAADAAVRRWVADRGWLAGGDPVEAWRTAEARHWAAFTAGRTTFAEQRRSRLRDFLPALGVAAEAHDADELLAEYDGHYRASWRAYADAAPLLRTLRAAGLRVAVLTNGDPVQQVAKLRRTGLLDLLGGPGAVLASGTLGVAKPDRRAFAALQERLGAPAGRTLFVGDDLGHDVGGALGAGLRPVHLDRDGRGGTPDGVARVASLDAVRAWLAATS